MAKDGATGRLSAAAHWRSPRLYKALLEADRRAFAWEWLRRHAPYRRAWRDRAVAPTSFGLLAFEDPDRATPNARPIWAPEADPKVLESRPTSDRKCANDLLDIRAFIDQVAVEVDQDDTEHWLLTNGQWMVRLDLHDGTLLGGPVLLGHHIIGFESAAPKLATLKQLGVLALRGDLPPAMCPREPRAPRWVLELRTADALSCGASQQDMARTFFGNAIPEARWRTAGESYRLRIRRLVRAARINLDDPFHGPWFR